MNDHHSLKNTLLLHIHIYLSARWHLETDFSPFHSHSFVFSFFFFISLEFVWTVDPHEGQKQIYIVYLGATRNIERESASAYYSTMLEAVGASKKSLVRSYTKSFHGFAAYMTENQQNILAAHDEVISVFPSRKLKLQTTDSWDFMGFPIDVIRNPTVESDIIIGVIDTGIWPASASFSDKGLGPPPKKWKGVCNGGTNFTCNNKIIGARSYVDDGTAFDTDGHGAHTASTAAGNEVQNASFFGIANGTARGAVPSARIAVYKVCDEHCSDYNVLSAFDDAIGDGVDILSVSISGDFPQDLRKDVVGIGALHALLVSGILTVQAAGNDFEYGSTISGAPWLISVAAGTTRRKFNTRLQLGNGNEVVSGNTLNSFDLNGKRYPLISGVDASRSTPCKVDPQAPSRDCDCLDSEKVKEKIVLCNFGPRTEMLFSAAGLIAQVFGDLDDSITVDIASTLLSPQDFQRVQLYYNSTKNPQATIFKSESAINVINAPVVASFSSRGPHKSLSDILKPDITAPGTGILAAYPPNISPFSIDTPETRFTPFNILSGTSMSCPHVTGAAAYIKSTRPNWSPPAIKSALMTTAKRMNANQSGDGNMEFSFGSGFLDPVKALNPGLVYETTKTDYVKLLCSIYNHNEIGKMFGENTTCPKNNASTQRDFNYPTMTARLNQSDMISVKFPRTVTNVGQANSTYKAIVTHIPQINITVEPSVLSFKELGEKQSFVVSVCGDIINRTFASLEWSDGIHLVRSPIVIYTNIDHELRIPM